MSEISDLVRSHVVETRPPDKQALELTDTTSLIDTGILDSVGVYDLVAFLEARFAIEVPDSKLAWENFETVELITRLVETLRSPGLPTLGR